jgi:LuxR family maltose regulon positive regulatory protein
MADQRVFRAKLHPPRLPTGSLERPRLMAKLDGGLDADVILVAAPAGYGKTTTVCQWLLRQPLPSAWLALDPADNDLWVFMAGLIAAVRTVHADAFRWPTGAFTGSDLPLVAALVEKFTDELEDLGEFVLVLDDCDSLRGEGALAFLDRVVRRMPQALRLVMLCRRDPSLPLGSLRGQGRLTEVRVKDLRFNEEEAAVFLQRSTGSPLSPDAVTSLVERTEGWIAGLHLAALSLREREDLETVIQDFTGSDRYIVDYLMEEVIARLPEPVREFLLATSILERLCAPLCALVVGTEGADVLDGLPILEWLERENLFLLSIDSERRWFRYHKLFLELLRQRLRLSRGSGEVDELHRRAGVWLAGERQVDAALDHLLAAGDVVGACALVIGETEASVDEERWHDLERWVRQLPREAVEAEPELLVAEAWKFQLRHAWDDLARNLDRAEALLEKLPETPRSVRLESEIWALRARWLYWQGDGPGTLDVALRAMDPSRPARPQARALAQTLVAGGLQLQGDTDAARRFYRRLQTGPDGDVMPPRGLAGLGLVELIAGDLTAVSDLADSIMLKARPLGLTDSVGWSHLLRGVVAYQRDDLDVAEEHFTAVASHPLGVHIVPVKECFFGLALVHRARGALEKSAMIADEAAGMLALTGNPALVSQARSLQMRLELLSGRQVALASWLEASGDLPEVFGLDVVWEYPPLTLTHAHIVDGTKEHLDRADSILSRLGEAAERSANTFRLIQVRCLQALLYDVRGDSPAALDALVEAVEFGRPGGFVRIYTDFGSHMLPLLERLLVGGRRDDHARRLIASCSTARGAGEQSAGRWTAGPAGVSDAAAGSARVASLLTNRELDVLVLLDQRLSNKEIARRLLISPATVKRHTLSIYSKLEVGGRREASITARELRILPLP